MNVLFFRIVFTFRWWVLLKSKVLGLLLFSALVFGCVFIQAEDDIAISVWQHKESGDSDTWYSVYKHSEKEWKTNQGKTAPVALLDGEDYDPDVSSSEAYAVSVWDHAGRIYSAVFDARGNLATTDWSAPVEIAGQSGKNVDPTVVVSKPSDAFSAWVAVDDDRSIHYSFGNGITWSVPVKLKGSKRASLPEAAAFGNGIVLVWVSPQGIHAAFYGAGQWIDSQLISTDAKEDLARPTDLRIGVAANKGEAIVVWTSKSGRVMFSKFSGGAWSAPTAYSTKQSPDVADSADGFYSVFEKDDDLWGSDFASTEVVSELEKDDLRPAITFISSKTVGVSVWWNPVDSPGEIYYSTKERGSPWAKPARVNGVELPELDRNPAIAPLMQIIAGETYCPDGILDPGEQCEIGIPCANPNAWCNVPTCTCHVEPPKCPNGILDPGEQCERGIPCPNPLDACVIPPCKCQGDVTPPPTVTPEDATLTPSPTPDDVTVTPSGVITPRCGDGYVSSPDKPGGGNEDCDLGGRFGAPINLSADDCPEGQICINCKCVSNDAISCSMHTFDVERMDVNRFKSSMGCVDDCAEIKGEDYECNQGSCTCTKKTVTITPIIDLTLTPTPYILTSVPTVTDIVITPVPTVITTGGQPTITDATPEPTATPTATPEPTATPSPTPCPDVDEDGVCDDQDNCQGLLNADQADADGDGRGDACDNCPNLATAIEVADADGDGIGDACDETPVDCASHCGGLGGFSIVSQTSTLQQGISQLTAQSCADLATGEPITCTTVCRYSSYQSWSYSVGDEVVNTFGCCCKKVFWLPCSNCPAEAPSVPECPTQTDCDEAASGKSDGDGIVV